MRIQKGSPRFSRVEMWNFDKSLSSVIVAGLKQYKEIKKHGIAPHIVENLSEEEYNAMSDEEHNKAWDELIDKMIFGFDEHPEFYKIEPSISDIVYNDTPIQHPEFGVIYTCDIVPKKGYTEDDVNAYTERMSEYNKNMQLKIKESRELFIKYFDSLWD